MINYRLILRQVYDTQAKKYQLKTILKDIVDFKLNIIGITDQ